ncbi:hypothetical protein PM082_016297 [Marasmius tenuissimus]|nr:hypothetical protein PM082_016297 [Marasmius tenuissimus]
MHPRLPIALTHIKSRKALFRYTALLAVCLFILGYHHFVRREQASQSFLEHQDLPLAPLLSSSETVYVISLGHRYDRRVDMEVLREALAIPQWTYVAATDAGEEIIERIMKNIRMLREWVVGEVHKSMDNNGGLDEKPVDPLAAKIRLPFRWPHNPGPGQNPQRLSQYSSLLDEIVNTNLYRDTNKLPTSQNPLACANGDFTLIPYTPTLGRHMIVSPARVACWHSHLKAIRNIAMNPQTNDITIILEDDIDMEMDIRQRLSPIWALLPADWDMIFLGHCWSDEAKYPPLQPPSNLSCTSPECRLQARNTSSMNSMHPSRAPQCTHAYALSPNGARKVYDHLSYPPFAYSRAIDQAFSWLVRSGRVKAFSVVPAVVVQRLPSQSGWLSWISSLGRPPRESDIWNRRSKWRDGLINGVFGTVR